MPSGLLTAFPFAALFLSGELFARQTAGAAFSSAADALPSAAEAVWAAFVLRRRSSLDSLLNILCHYERRRLALAGGCCRLYSPRIREGVFSETGLPIRGLPGNSLGLYRQRQSPRLVYRGLL